MNPPTSLLALWLGCGGATESDSDGDTILDIHEGPADFDGDGTPNYLDLDSDGDGIGDARETGDDDPLTLPVDNDLDGDPDFLDLDSDDNCVPDADEAGSNPAGGPADSDGDSIFDFQDFDNDGDHITDVDEIGEDCANPDSDDDGVPDHLDDDSDGDGIGDKWEAGTTIWQDDPVDTDGDGTPDYLDDDSDGDGLSDAEEVGVTSPGVEPRDTDGDGVYDFRDLDADGDGLRDSREAGDLGTDPYDWDTDGDGLSDGLEVGGGCDPLDASSVCDAVLIEVPHNSAVIETFAIVPEIQRLDVAWIFDTTCASEGMARAMASEFEDFADELAGLVPSPAYGFATHDDYAFGSYGSADYGDKPYILRQQVTEDPSQFQYSITHDWEVHYGGDGPESGMEALYQASTGAGYDQGCDGSYDESTDVPPFIASVTDPFGGTTRGTYDPATPGGGMLGGMGFRDGSLPVIVFGADQYIRDPDADYGTPGGCWLDAGQSDVVDAMATIRARMVAVAVNGDTAASQLQAIAEATGSTADTDGDGDADDLLYFEWSGAYETYRQTLTSTMEDILATTVFDEVALVPQDDAWGFVWDVDPGGYPEVGDLGTDALSFTLRFYGAVEATTTDQYFPLPLNLLGDDYVVLGSIKVIVVVPGERR